MKQNGYALQYVEEQTPEICLAAVKQNGYSLRYVNPKIFESIEDEDMVDLGGGIVISKESIKSLIGKSLK